MPLFIEHLLYNASGTILGKRQVSKIYKNGYPRETHYFCDYRWLLNTSVRKLFHKEIVVGRKLEQVVGVGVGYGMSVAI